MYLSTEDRMCINMPQSSRKCRNFKTNIYFSSAELLRKSIISAFSTSTKSGKKFCPYSWFCWGGSHLLSGIYETFKDCKKDKKSEIPEICFENLIWKNYWTYTYIKIISHKGTFYWVTYTSFFIEWPLKCWMQITSYPQLGVTYDAIQRSLNIVLG